MTRKWTILLLLLLTTVGIKAQRYDNYPPDNRRVALDSTNLPILFIDTHNKMILRDDRITATLRIVWNGDGAISYKDTLAHPGQNIDYDGYIALRYRGNSSFDFSDKKPYSFRPITKPLEEDGWEKKKVELLGMGKDNNWVLLAPYSDRSMIRDVLGLSLARHYLDFAPAGKHCELFLNGTYYGVYVLCEKVSKGKHRLNLEDPGTAGDELTGGYLVQIDRNDEEHVYRSKHHPESPWGTMTNQFIYFQYEHPDYEDMTSSQRNYLHRRIDAMENALASADYKDPDTGYRKYLDMMSFIDHELSTEFCHNVDGYRLSTPLYKHRDSKNPLWKLSLWDLNLAFGNSNYYDGSATDTWVYQQNDIMAWQDNNLIPFWWERLMSDDNYVEALKARWTQYRKEVYSDEQLTAIIDSLYSVLTIGGAADRNTKAWPRWNRYLWPNQYVSSSLEDEFDYLRGWIADRVAFMDSQWLDYAGVHETQQDRLPMVWPQPALSGGELHVAANGPDHLSLYTTEGRLLRSVATHGEVGTMSLAGVPPGLYLLKSRSGNRKIIVK